MVAVQSRQARKERLAVERRQLEEGVAVDDVADEYDRLADVLRAAFDVPALYRMAGL